MGSAGSYTKIYKYIRHNRSQFLTPIRSLISRLFLSSGVSTEMESTPSRFTTPPPLPSAASFGQEEEKHRKRTASLVVFPTASAHADASVRTASMSHLHMRPHSSVQDAMNEESLDVDLMRLPSYTTLLTRGVPSGLELRTKTLNHDAIVRHFQLRRVVEEQTPSGSRPSSSRPREHLAHQEHTESNTDAELNDLEYEDDGDDDDVPVATTSLFTERMINAAKIHEFRKLRNQDSTRRNLHVSPKEKSVAARPANPNLPTTPVPSGGGLSIRRRLARWKRRTTRHLKRLIREPFSPTGTISHARAALILLTMLVQLFYLPFGPVYYPGRTVGTTTLNVAIDVFYVLDLLATCNTAYYEKPLERIETSRRKILSRYLKSWFMLDLISCIPVDVIVWSAVPTRSTDQRAVAALLSELPSFVRFMSWASFLHALWLARVIRVTKDVWLRLLYNRFSYVLSLLRLVLLLALTTHYTACFWRLVQLLDHGDAVDIHDGGVWDTYMTDVYYAVQLLQGHGGVARTTRDHVFSSVAVLIGILVLATLSGSLAVLIFNYYSNSSSYQRKLESVFAKMDKLHLPPSLRARIHQYYDHLWFEHDSLNGEIAQFTRELSPSLALEVRLFKYMDLVLRVPLWRDCSTDFVTQIMLRLNVRAYLPEDYVIRQGEIGEELFLLNRGVCELRACSGTSTGISDPLIPLHHRSPSTIVTEGGGGGGGQNINVRRLMPGHAFGELALLMNYKRSATVRALTFVEMCLLSRQAFQEILLRYREDRGKVLKELVLSCIDMRDKRFIPFPWEELIERANAKAPAVSAHTRLSPEEAADRIVDLINPPERTDTSITFGFRDLDIVSGFQLLPAVSLVKTSPAYREPSLDGSHSELKTQVELIANRQEQTLERLATLERTVTSLVAEIRQSSI